MFIASASDQRLAPQRERGRESERKTERGRERDRWGKANRVRWEDVGGWIAQKVDNSVVSVSFSFPFRSIFLCRSASIHKLTLHHLHLWPALHMFDWHQAPCNIYIPGMAGAPKMLCCSTRVSAALQIHAAVLPSSDVTLCCHVGVTCQGHIITARHWAECHCALSAIDTASLPAIVCVLPRRSPRRCLLNYSIWKVCEVCFAECDTGTEGKVFTYSFILLLLLHSRKPSITAWGGAGGNRKWMLSAVVPMETLEGGTGELGPCGIRVPLPY